MSSPVLIEAREPRSIDVHHNWSPGKPEVFRLFVDSEDGGIWLNLSRENAETIARLLISSLSHRP